MTRLRPRLQAALDLVPAGARVADVCCDHGLLAIAAAHAGAPHVIAVDVAAAPLALAAHNLQLAALHVPGLAVAVSLRRGDGLTCLRPGEVDGAVIAGVGGRTCMSILAPADQPNLLHTLDLRWLVLQVNRDLPKVRVWLAARGWRTERETLVRDGRRIFPTLLATPHHPPRALSPAQAYLGELPRDADPALHGEHLRRRQAKLGDEVRAMAQTVARRPSPALEAQYNERRAWLSAVEAALEQALLRAQQPALQ